MIGILSLITTTLQILNINSLNYLDMASMYDGGNKCFEFSNPSLPVIILSTIRSG